MLREMKVRTAAVLAAALLFAGPAARADEVKLVLKNGNRVEGALVDEGKEEIVVRVKYGTIGVARADIASMERVPAAPEPPQGAGEPKSPLVERWKSEAGAKRIPGWDACVEALDSRGLRSALRQIPATVIDVGALKHVPYISHRAGDYEFNVYGDPDAPACVEIGIAKDATKTDAARKDCFGVIWAIFTNEADRRTLALLDMKKDKRERDGLVFEVTPPDAEDAYGGWWISIYSGAALDSARARADELARITAREPGAAAKEKKKDPFDWSVEDYKLARPPTRAPGEASDPGRTVYVRGYHKKDGTYVGAAPPPPPGK